MKHFTIFVLLATAVMQLYAQKSKVATALNYKENGNLDKALLCIEDALDRSNPKTQKSISWPRSWEVRAEIYEAIFNSSDETFHKLHADPLTEAFNSYMNAIELDTKNRNKNSLLFKLQLLIQEFSKQAEKAFSENDFEKALTSFEYILAIENVPIFRDENPELVDSVIIYNAALTAQNAKKYDEAIEYYKKAVACDYNTEKTYGFLSDCYLLKKDTVGSLQIMNEGLKKYPHSTAILVKLVNTYGTLKDYEKAMSFLDQAILNEPSNETFHFFKGFLFEQMQTANESINCYKKAIELKPDFSDAYFNLGILYYNRGVHQLDIANAVSSEEPAKYEAEKEKANLEFRNALPYLEKALELKKNDPLTLESLKNIYYRLQMLDKHEKMNEILKSISN